MHTELAGRTARVTGASVGIGRACARALALEGVHVAIVAAGKARPVTIAIVVMQPDAARVA